MPEPLLPADLPPDLLQYGFSTLPSPVQVSSASASSPAAINVWAAAPTGQAVFCSTITIGVPIGPAATDLTTQTPSVTPNTTWWAVSSLVIESGEAIGLDPQTSYAIFTASCTSDAHWLIDYDLQFSIVTAQVNQAEGGPVGIVVAEKSGTSKDALQQRRSVYTLTKGPVTTYLNSVMATAPPPGATDVPLSEFTAGSAVRLAWESNAASFAVYAGAQTSPLWTGTDTSVELTQGFTEDTTLTVVAKAADGGVLTASTTVTIANPTLTPASVTAGTLTVTGQTKLAGAVLASLGAATLNVAGAATLAGAASAGTLSGAGGTTVHDALTAASLGVSGAVTAAGATAVGGASARSLTVQSSAAMMNPHSIAPGSYVASSDGLVIGVVSYPSDAGKKCAAIAYGSSPGVGTVYARGGNRVFWNSSKKWSMWIVSGTFVLPVRRGNGFNVNSFQVQGGDVNAPVQFTWVPFGTSAALTALTAEEATAYGLADTAPPPVAAFQSPRVGGEVGGLLEAAQAVLGDRLTPELADRLSKAVVTLASRH